jgi:hypothetical protein
MGRFETEWLANETSPRSPISPGDDETGGAVGDDDADARIAFHNQPYAVALVADQSQAEPREDWRQNRAPWTLRHLPNGRGGGAAAASAGVRRSETTCATNRGGRAP